MKRVAYVGLDAHQESITVAVLPRDAEQFAFEARIENRYAAVLKLMRRLSEEYELRCCYEASGGGYVLHRWLRKMEIACAVVAPSKVPVHRGGRQKNDRRDAQHLAQQYRAGTLTEVRVPSEEEESVRSLARCRETLMKEVVASKHHVRTFLLSLGLVYRDGQNWTQKHWQWLRKQALGEVDQTVLDEYLALLEYKQSRLEELDRRLEAIAFSDAYKEDVGKLRCFRGLDTHSAMVLLAETGDFSRFGRPRQLMAYWGLIPGEHSSGGSIRHGPITKAGNRRCRRILVEAAWHYQHRPALGKALSQRQQGQPPGVVAHTWKAQHRLHKKYSRIAHRKEKQKAVVAVARELAGFIWAVMNNAPPQERAVA